MTIISDEEQMSGKIISSGILKICIEEISPVILKIRYLFWSAKVNTLLRLDSEDFGASASI